MAEKEKMASYKVKSQIILGVRDEKAEDPTAPGAVTYETYEAGDTVQLTEKEAASCRHALHNPPPLKRVLRAEEGVDVDEDEEEAIESIQSNPEHPESGVQPFWKVDQLAVAHANLSRSRLVTKGTKPVGGGMERANVGQNANILAPGPLAIAGPQPDSNKTEEQLKAEEGIRKAEEKERKAAEKK